MELANTNRSPIRIAQVIGHTANGGIESFVMNYYKHIDHTRYEFNFFVESESLIVNQNEISKYGNGKIVLIPSYKKLSEYMSSMKRLFKEGNYDIVHSNMNALSVFTLKAAKEAGISIRIAHSHSMSNPKEPFRNLLKDVLKTQSHRYATAYFACSEEAGRWLFGDKAFDNHEVVVMNNAIDLDRFAFKEEGRKAIRQKYHIKDSTFVLGFMGRLVTQKNPDFALKVFAKYHSIQPDSALMMVGEGQLSDDIKKKAGELGIQDFVVLTGSEKNTEDYYSAFDLLLFPSLYEGLGLSAVEAQASNLICLASSFVPKQAQVIDSMKFLSLEDLDSWVRNIPFSNEYSRQQERELFTIHGYDINKESRKLCQMYDNLIIAAGGGEVNRCLASSLAPWRLFSYSFSSRKACLSL
jgi:glycosyltransferase involved in cell wall biosynthesis